MDQLTKSTHFIAYNMTYQVERISLVYLLHAVRQYGVPVSIVSNCDAWFTSRFWVNLHKEMGTSLKKSTTFHPQTDGQTEHTNQVMEDILKVLEIVCFKNIMRSRI